METVTVLRPATVVKANIILHAVMNVDGKPLSLCNTNKLHIWSFKNHVRFAKWTCELFPVFEVAWLPGGRTWRHVEEDSSVVCIRTYLGLLLFSIGTTYISNWGNKRQMVYLCIRHVQKDLAIWAVSIQIETRRKWEADETRESSYCGVKIKYERHGIRAKQRQRYLNQQSQPQLPVGTAVHLEPGMSLGNHL